MAQKVVVHLVSDLTGEPIAEGEGSTVQFGLDGTSFEVDLSSKEEDAFREALQPYLENARKASNGRGRQSSAKASSSPKGNREETQKIREWAASQGLNVASRGRINQEIVDKYNEANK